VTHDIFPLAAIDFETTGTDVATARIVQVGVAVTRGELVHSWQEYVNPGIPIPPEATAIHGITDAMVADAKPWGPVLLCQLAVMLEGVRAITGYNVRRYDLPLLDAEHNRTCGALAKPWQGIPVIDAIDVWHRVEPRNLSAAVLKWTGRDHVAAHTAGADAEASIAVLRAMLSTWGQEGDAATLAQAALPPDARNWIDSQGKLARMNGIECINFGKYKGTPLVMADAGFLRWMLEPARGFPNDALEYVRKELTRRASVRLS